MTLAQTAMQIVHAASKAWEDCASTMEQFALGLGFPDTDLGVAWDWLQLDLARQTEQGRIPNIQNPLAGTAPFHTILAWYWWKKDPVNAQIDACFDALLQTHRYWYSYRDTQDIGLPCLNFSEEHLLPDLVESLYGNRSFQIQDPAFLGLLCRANECLIELGEAFGKELSEILEWNELTVFGLNEDLWDPQSRTYRLFDVQKQQHLPADWLSNYVPLWAGIPDQDQAEFLCRDLVKGFFQEDFWVLPTQKPAPNAQTSESNAVISPLLNRLIYAGLLRYGFKENANYLHHKFLQMVGSYGFYSSYQAFMHPYANIGIGKGNAACTAAIVLDMANGIVEKQDFDQQL